ncbi:hypothetical protein GGI43DRAFT_399707 [Trichoderma evansii]
MILILRLLFCCHLSSFLANCQPKSPDVKIALSPRNNDKYMYIGLDDSAQIISRISSYKYIVIGLWLNLPRAPFVVPLLHRSLYRLS